MTDIKPKDGEWWVLCHLNNGDMCVGCFVSGSFYQSQNHSEVPESAYSDDFEPLYRISRHHPINDVLEAARNGAKVHHNGDPIEHVYGDLDSHLSKFGVSPEEKPLVIPWDALNPHWKKAKLHKNHIQFFDGVDGEHNDALPTACLNIDLTDVPDGATAERPE